LDVNGIQVPFYWSPSSGFVALAENSGDSRNYGFGINDLSEVTGQRYTGEVVHAYLWAPLLGKHQITGSLPGGLHSVGTAINNLRHITGTASTATGRFDAFVWSKGAGMRDIGVIAGGTYTSGRAVNDSDQVVGFGLDGAGRFIGFYWSRSAGMTLLQTLGGSQSGGFGINSSGAITGYSTNAAGAFHAAIWADQTRVPQDLGTLPGGANSYGQGINSEGQVVGYADVP